MSFWFLRWFINQLLEIGPLFSEVLPSKYNRDGLAITSRDCLDAAEGRSKAGFVPSMLRAICVQMPVDAEKVREFLDACEAACALDDALPRVKRNQVSAMGLGGNHNNMFFRMVKQRRPCESFCSADEDGIMVLAEEKLRAVDAAMADACRDGVAWVVLSSAMLLEEPDSEYIIQAAENLVGSCRLPPGFLDALSRSCNYLEKMNPAEATTALCVQFPSMHADIPNIVGFCEKMGSESPHIKLWLHMSNLMLAKHRVPKTNFLKAVADISLKWPDCKMSMLWAAQTCPDKYAEGLTVGWISKSDVVAAKPKPEWNSNMNLAQSELAERFKKISTKSLKSDLRKWGSLLGMVGRFLLAKKDKGFKDHASLLEIFEAYDAAGNETSGIGGPTPCQSAGSTGSAALQVAIKAEIVKRGEVKYVDGVLVDEEALLREAGLVECVYLQTTVALLKLLRAKNSRGMGSPIL